MSDYGGSNAQEKFFLAHNCMYKLQSYSGVGIAGFHCIQCDDNNNLYKFNTLKAIEFMCLHVNLVMFFHALCFWSLIVCVSSCIYVYSCCL